MCACRSGRRFLGCPQDRWSHGTFGVEELEGRVEDETQYHVEFGDDAEFEFVGVLEPIEEREAVEVLATWKQTKTAMTQEKLKRGLPVRQHLNSTSITK